MNDLDLIRKLICEIQIEDIETRYHPMINAVGGVEKFIDFLCVVGGNLLYFPTIEKMVTKAKERRIRKEYKGSYRELTRRYGMSSKAIQKILFNK